MSDLQKTFLSTLDEETFCTFLEIIQERSNAKLKKSVNYKNLLNKKQLIIQKQENGTLKRWYSNKSFQRDEARKCYPDLVKCYGEICLCCGISALGENVKLVVDHIIPLVPKGTSRIDNLQLLCLKCNFRKGLKIIDYRPFSFNLT